MEDQYKNSPLLIESIEMRDSLFNKNHNYKKINRDVFLDYRLNNNDLIIYLAILQQIGEPKRFVKIHNKIIEIITNIKQPNQGKSIKKLSDLNYIEVKNNGLDNLYRLYNYQTSYLVFSIDIFINLRLHKEHKRIFIYLLRALFLSWGNNKIPRYNSCLKNVQGKFPRVLYRRLSKIYNSHSVSEELDIHIYHKLNESNESYNELYEEFLNRKQKEEEQDKEQAIELNKQLQELIDR